LSSFYIIDYLKPRKITELDMKLKINKEYLDMVPPQTQEEYEELKKNIVENGQHVPICYNEEGEILDGHHRFKICNELGIIPKIEEKPRVFESKLYEKLFVIDMNLQRRQLIPYVRGILALKAKPIIEAIAKAKIDTARHRLASQNSDEPFGLRTDEEVGKRARLSRDTIRNIELIEKNGSKNQKMLLSQGKIQINPVASEIKKKIKLAKYEAKKGKQALTDLEIMEGVGWSIRPYDVWNFRLDERFGWKYPGNIPAEIVANTLYFFTKQGDLIIDPMAGGGVVGDVCKRMERKCKMFDINPIRKDIQKIDLAQGFPDMQADLVFWDPPYFKKFQQEYGPNSISSLSKTEYLRVFSRAAREIKADKVALLMSDYDDEYNGHPENNIFIDEYIELFKKHNWRVLRIIQCPLSTEQIAAPLIINYKENKKLGRISRNLIIFSKVKLK